MLSQFKAAAEDHAGYLHALADVRSAHWLLAQPGDWKPTAEESAAIKHLVQAITDIKSASIDDGKVLNTKPQIVEATDHAGRLRQAIEFLRKARQSVNQETDADFSDKLKERTLTRINESFRLSEKALETITGTQPPPGSH